MTQGTRPCGSKAMAASSMGAEVYERGSGGAREAGVRLLEVPAERAVAEPAAAHQREPAREQPGRQGPDQALEPGGALQGGAVALREGGVGRERGLGGALAGQRGAQLPPR